MNTRALLLAVAGLGLVVPRAWPAEAVSAAAGPAQVVVLTYAEGNEPLAAWQCTFTSQSSRFAKEPDTAKSAVTRGRLELGRGSTNSFACLWDRTNLKLYLDLNHNGDLTDDPAGVFTAPTKGSSQVFTGVRVPVKTSSGLHAFLLNLTFFTYGPGTVSYVTVNPR